METHVKLKLTILTMFLAAAVPMFGQAQYCYGSLPYTCQYLADNGLEQGTTYWSYSSGSGPATVSDACAWGGGVNTTAADLDPDDSVFQTFDTDDFDVWSIRLDLYKTSTSVTSADFFEVIVHNYTTNQSETHYVYASSYSGLCGSVIPVNLTNNYGNSTVRVRVRKNWQATATMYVDNIAMFGHN